MGCNFTLVWSLVKGMDHEGIWGMISVSLRVLVISQLSPATDNTPTPISEYSMNMSVRKRPRKRKAAS